MVALCVVATLFCVDAKAQDFQQMLSSSLRGSVAPAAPDLDRDFDNLIIQARRAGSVKVIVGFRVDNYRPDSELGDFGQSRQRNEIKQKQQSLLNRLSAFEVINPKQFDYIPFMAMEVSADALIALRGSPDITSIQEDQQQQTSLLQSVPILGAQNAWAAGFTGQGRTVAVLDTGVDKFHPFFNGRVVSEACYSTTSATSQSYCPGSVGQSTAPNSGLNCPTFETDQCKHGFRRMFLVIILLS